MDKKNNDVAPHKKDHHSVTEHNNLGLDQAKKNQRMHDIVSGRISHLRRKLSRGAANIYRMIRTRCRWGNKGLMGDEHINRPRQHKK